MVPPRLGLGSSTQEVLGEHMLSKRRDESGGREGRKRGRKRRKKERGGELGRANV